MITPEASDDSQEEQAETVEIPLSAFKGAKEGDMLKIVSVDSEGGTITAEVQDSEADDQGGSDSMAEEFNQPQEQ